ncbi:hypothetical protein [Cysteiniphilum sp. QT6929]|uniref:hypothetical protein n=1 Tax=Cysteiniphilum sp. QT6929 TaxID=2975055 RepID=UPI0024B35536|nr:hypothetical protein [Cysteiniphilum sp. QT6929]WHN66304.1 hypothetical protein NYP54_03480 [Cysteiniphilum sp. QT6929]
MKFKLLSLAFISIFGVANIGLATQNNNVNLTGISVSDINQQTGTTVYGYTNGLQQFPILVTLNFDGQPDEDTQQHIWDRIGLYITNAQGVDQQNPYKLSLTHDKQGANTACQQDLFAKLQDGNLNSYTWREGVPFLDGSYTDASAKLHIDWTPNQWLNINNGQGSMCITSIQNQNLKTGTYEHPNNQNMMLFSRNALGDNPSSISRIFYVQLRAQQQLPQMNIYGIDLQGDVPVSTSQYAILASSLPTNDVINGAPCFTQTSLPLPQNKDDSLDLHIALGYQIMHNNMLSSGHILYARVNKNTSGETVSTLQFGMYGCQEPFTASQTQNIGTNANGANLTDPNNYNYFDYDNTGIYTKCPLGDNQCQGDNRSKLITYIKAANFACSNVLIHPTMDQFTQAYFNRSDSDDAKQGASSVGLDVGGNDKLVYLGWARPENYPGDVQMFIYDDFGNFKSINTSAPISLSKTGDLYYNQLNGNTSMQQCTIH